MKASEIRVPKPALSPTAVRSAGLSSSLAEEADKAVRDANYQALCALNDKLEPITNKNERATILIEACISDGIDTKGGIINTLFSLGFDKKHVAALLQPGKPSRAPTSPWYVDAEGRYDLR